MFGLNLKLFVRNFRKNIIINSLNLLGLSAGLAACMLIIIYLRHEFNYDTYHANAERIVRINTDQKVGDGQLLHIPSASFPVAPGLASSIGGVENFVRLSFNPAERPIYIEDRIFLERNIAWADSTLFDVFSFGLVYGAPRTALVAPKSVVLSMSSARKFFGEENPIGRQIGLSRENVYTVTGVMEDVRQPSHFPSFPMVMAMSEIPSERFSHWVGQSSFYAYLLLAEGETPATVQPLADQVYLDNAKELLALLSADCRIFLQPLRDIHFDGSLDFNQAFQPTVSHQKLAVFAVLAFFILLVASVSFINLATARSGERARQVGISKAIGSSRGVLASQFIGEFVFLSLIALLIAFILVDLLLPVFSGLVGRELATDYGSRPWLPAAFVLMALAVGVLAGIYPAVFLSSFRPSDTIRAGTFSSPRRSRLRPALIIFQFAVSIILVICTITVNQQLRYMDNRYPGFDKEQLMVITTAPDMTADDCVRLRDEALQHPGVLKGTLSSYLPTMGHMENTYDVPDPVNCGMLMTRQFIVDEDFLETLGIELVSGRNFERGNPEAVGKSVIINEKAAATLGYDDAVGRLLDANPAKGPDNYDPVTIIGVMKDINFESFHHDIKPMLLIQGRMRPSKITLRLRPDSVRDAIGHVEGIWKGINPGTPMRFSFLDETYDSMYLAEIRLGRLFSFFTALAVVISCVGLLALITYSAERRTREVSIRKVLGASLGNLFYLLSSEYLRLVVAANLIAWPVAAWAMMKWMDNFAYRAPFAYWLYPLAGLIALALALVTAVSLTLRVCRLDPARTLRQE